MREDWLALTREEPVDPGLPIIDAHHHLWDKPGQRYMREEMTADIVESGHDVVATVFVEGRTGYRPSGDPQLRSVGETEMAAWVAADSARQARQTPLLAAGIVAFVDLCAEAAGDLLDHHMEAAGGRLRGIRHTSAWHADPDARGSIVEPPPAGLLYDPAFRRGVKELVRRGLVFDAWMYHTQLGDAVDLAHALPEARIVLDHTGGPIGIGPYEGRRAEVFEDWRHFMRRLSRHQNVSVKLGGFGMLMSGFTFQDEDRPPASDDLAEAWAPYHRECMELFGVHRCMFESNFPVDKGTASYGVVWNAFKKIASGCSADEKHSLFFQSANSTYGLALRADASYP